MRSAEFDKVAESYHAQHKASIAITGEEPEFFAEYKIADIAGLVDDGPPIKDILDFGSGIGNSIPFFRKYFGASQLSCADVSSRCIDLARERFPGSESYVLIDRDRIELPDDSQDMTFSACVFHHIDHHEHARWLRELRRVTRPGGMLVIYEHNPLNPLTVRAVRTCPFDANARLIHSRALRETVLHAGWERAEIVFRLFFPNQLAALRPLESWLGWLPLGAQYRLIARAPA